jgi:transposase
VWQLTVHQRIGKRLESMVHLLFSTGYWFENNDITEAIYRRRVSRRQRNWREGLAQGARDGHTLRHKNRCPLLLKHDLIHRTLLSHHAIPMTNNRSERSLPCDVLWRKGSYGVWSYQGEQFRQHILTIVESCRKVGSNPLQTLSAIVRSVIEKTEYPSLPELDALSQ